MMAYSYIETQTLGNGGQNTLIYSINVQMKQVKVVWNWFEKRTMNVEQPLRSTRVIYLLNS